MVEHEKRYDYADGLDGIDESMSIDNCLHSLFGASKVAADVMCRSSGRFSHARRHLPRRLSYGAAARSGRTAWLPGLHHCLRISNQPYTILGYKGKQVRDQIHCRDVARLFLEFYHRRDLAKFITWRRKTE